MSAVWLLEDGVARLQTPPFNGTIDLARPAGGLKAAVGKRSGGVGASLLGVELPGKFAVGPSDVLEDVYVRGDDLVATYRQTHDAPARVQVYWRWRDAVAGSRASIDVEVSVQTSLLDSDPELRVRSGLRAEAAWRLVDPSRGTFERLDAGTSGDAAVLESTKGTGCLVWQPGEVDWSYAEMIHPSDFRGDTISVVDQGDGVRIEVARQLFPERLEKGVIRRARVRGLLVGRQHDQQVVAEAYRQFAVEEPPLTT